MIESKLQTVLEILLTHKSQFITVNDIAEKMNISCRTVHNYLNHEDFKKMIYPANLIKKSNKGICLQINPNDVHLIQNITKQSSISNSSENDIDIIIKSLLFEEKQTISDFCQMLYTSPGKVRELINNLNSFMFSFHVSVQLERKRFYSLVGDETNIREMFYSYLISEYNSTLHSDSYNISHFTDRLVEKNSFILQSLFQPQDIQKLINIMNVIEKITNSYFTDEDYNKTILQIAIMIIRCYNNKYATSKLCINENSQEYYYASLVRIYLEKDFNIQTSGFETFYIACLLLGARKQINQPCEADTSEVLEKFLKILSIRLNFEFTTDYELKQNLLNHLRPAIHRIRHGMSNKNPLLTQIKENYTEVYMAVMTTIEDIEDIENIFFDSDELGYICLHIIAAVNRPSNIKKYKAALLCNEGLSIEIFLKNIIESYFHEIEIKDIFCESNLYKLNCNDYNLVINTTNHKFSEDNVLHISKNFTSIDHSVIRHHLNHINQGMSLGTNGMTDYLLFFHDSNLYTQNSLIKKYCQLLEENSYVKSSFYDSVINRMQSSGTYVARGIAVPHGSKETVQRSVISMIHLDTPILWDNEKADLILLVATNDEDTSNFSYLFRKIMRIASNDNLSSQLKKCTTLNDLQALLDKVTYKAQKYEL